MKFTASNTPKLVDMVTLRCATSGCNNWSVSGKNHCSSCVFPSFQYPYSLRPCIEPADGTHDRRRLIRRPFPSTTRMRTWQQHGLSSVIFTVQLSNMSLGFCRSRALQSFDSHDVKEIRAGNR